MPQPTPSPAQSLCDVARLLYERDLTELCGGNVSLRHEGRIYITPTCAAQYFLWNLAVKDVVVLAPDGAILQGDKSRLSRENDLHLSIYQAHPAVGSVFHLHTVELMLLAQRPDLLEGPLRDYLRQQRVGLAILEPRLVGQTPEHDARLLELLAGMDPDRPAVVVGPGHGIFAAAADSAANLACIDSLACRLRRLKLTRELERAAR